MNIFQNKVGFMEKAMRIIYVSNEFLLVYNQVSRLISSQLSQPYYGPVIHLMHQSCSQQMVHNCILLMPSCQIYVMFRWIFCDQIGLCSILLFQQMSGLVLARYWVPWYDHKSAWKWVWLVTFSTPDARVVISYDAYMYIESLGCMFITRKSYLRLYLR